MGAAPAFPNGTPQNRLRSLPLGVFLMAFSVCLDGPAGWSGARSIPMTSAPEAS